ncbi:MAG: Maf family protein [Spirochaetota bacterium]|nr:Maf family protein [Spirochaetota bacterium]
MNIILGSSSPRRKHLLQQMFNTITIIHPVVEEIPHPHEKPLQFVQRASSDKLNNIRTKIFTNPSLVITCDTIVTIDNEILGKPADFDHAYYMLSKLSGKTHHVISAISLLYSNKNDIRQHDDYEITQVTFKKLNESDITAYLSHINYNDKAGAYAAQEYGTMIIEKTAGSITNVIGFPLRCFFRMIVDMDIIQKLFQ